MGAQMQKPNSAAPHAEQAPSWWQGHTQLVSWLHEAEAQTAIPPGSFTDSKAVPNTAKQLWRV